MEEEKKEEDDGRGQKKKKKRTKLSGARRFSDLEEEDLDFGFTAIACQKPRRRRLFVEVKPVHLRGACL